MISPELMAKVMLDNGEHLYRLSLVSGSETARTLCWRMENYRIGDMVFIDMTRYNVPAIRRIGRLVKDELVECEHQDDEEFRGPDWKPLTERTWTIECLDGELRSWTDVRVMSISL